MARIYPSHPLVSCHALLMDGDRMLLVQRARPPFQGSWGLPGGGVELGETVAQAIVREVHEETGLHVEVSRFLDYTDAIARDAEQRIMYHYVIFYFQVVVQGGELRPADDATQVEWVTVSEALTRPHTDAVDRCLLWLNSNTGKGVGQS
jgi:8-oxo-dGTP diphosphatase